MQAPGLLVPSAWQRRTTALYARCAVSRAADASPGRPDPAAREAHDEALSAQGSAPVAPGVTVHGQRCTRGLSQWGLARGVTVVTHGQTGPPRRPTAPPPADEAPPLTEAEWAASAAAAARAALAAADAALAAGDAEGAVQLYTRVLRAASAGAQECDSSVAAAYAGRADAHAAAGDWRRALADAEDAAAAQPVWAAAHERCGRAAAKLGLAQDAEQAFARAAALNSTEAASDAACADTCGAQCRCAKCKPGAASA
jgi:tetratricopeptide (TPR) repeat protein